MKKRNWILLGLLGLGALAITFGPGQGAPEARLLENDAEEIEIEIEGEGEGEIEIEIGEEPIPLSPLPDLIPPEPAQPVEEESWPGLDETQIAYVKEILELVNEAREEAGLSPLTLDSALCGAAQVRAKECVTTFSHTRPDGTSYKTAITQAGVESNYTGENVATGQKTAAQVMEAWMKSEGHRANILNEKFTKLGVGLEPNVGNKYKGYAWAQLFVK